MRSGRGLTQGGAPRASTCRLETRGGRGLGSEAILATFHSKPLLIEMAAKKPRSFVGAYIRPPKTLPSSTPFNRFQHNSNIPELGSLRLWSVL